MIKHCLGCGTALQSEDKNKPGYILDINKDYCMRCFRLTHYNEKTVTIVHNDIKEIKSIVNNKKGLTFYFVDFLNISEETLKYYYDIEGEKCLVISKSDTIPKSIYLERIREWLRTCFNIHESILFIRKSSRSSVKKILDIMDNSNKRIFYFLGVTNAGKSTFINSYAGKASAKTGNKPGVTKGKQWIKLNKNVELLDTPGILWPKFDNQEVGKRLAMIGSMNDEILNVEELAIDTIKYIYSEYSDNVIERYGLDKEKTAASYDENAINPDNSVALYIMEQAAVKRGCIKKGNNIDYEKISNIILDDFRSGRIGRISLETP